MNDYMKIVPFIKKWEGGLSNSQLDSAKSFPCPTPHNGKLYHTNKGITYAAWKAKFGEYKNARFLNMNDADWGTVFKDLYWEPVNADAIPYESISFILVSWAWGSGTGTACEKFQRALNELGANLTVDGKIGPKTCAAVAAHNERELFDALCNVRERFFRYISDPSNGKTEARKKQYANNQKNLKGWLNRLNDFRKTFRPK